MTIRKIGNRVCETPPAKCNTFTNAPKGLRNAQSVFDSTISHDRAVRLVLQGLAPHTCALYICLSLASSRSTCDVLSNVLPRAGYASPSRSNTRQPTLQLLPADIHPSRMVSRAYNERLAQEKA